MDHQPLTTRILEWIMVRLPVIPLAMSIIFLYIYQESHLTWAYRWLLLSFGMFLMMPGWMLLFRPNLTISLFNALYITIFVRRNTSNAKVVIQQDWQSLKDGPRYIITLLSTIAFIAGLLLFGVGIQY